MLTARGHDRASKRRVGRGGDRSPADEAEAQKANAEDAREDHLDRAAPSARRGSAGNRRLASRIERETVACISSKEVASKEVAALLAIASRPLRWGMWGIVSFSFIGEGTMSHSGCLSLVSNFIVEP